MNIVDYVKKRITWWIQNKISWFISTIIVTILVICIICCALGYGVTLAVKNGNPVKERLDEKSELFDRKMELTRERTGIVTDINIPQAEKDARVAELDSQIEVLELQIEAIEDSR